MKLEGEITFEKLVEYGRNKRMFPIDYDDSDMFVSITYQGKKYWKDGIITDENVRRSGVF